MSDFISELVYRFHKAHEVPITTPTVNTHLASNLIGVISEKKNCCGGKKKENALPPFIKQAGSLINSIPSIMIASGEYIKNKFKSKDTYEHLRNSEEVLRILQACETCEFRANAFTGWEDTIRCSLCGCYMELKAPIKDLTCANADTKYSKRPGWTGLNYWALLESECVE
jgi:hypothetical protein